MSGLRDRIMSVLETVPDPEVPVVSVVDLGMDIGSSVTIAELVVVLAAFGVVAAGLKLVGGALAASGEDAGAEDAGASAKGFSPRANAPYTR